MVSNRSSPDGYSQEKRRHVDLHGAGPAAHRLPEPLRDPERRAAHRPDRPALGRGSAGRQLHRLWRQRRRLLHLQRGAGVRDGPGCHGRQGDLLRGPAEQQVPADDAVGEGVQGVLD